MSREKERAQEASYRARKREHIRAYDRAYYAGHKDKRKAYYAEHAEERRAYQREYKRRRKEGRQKKESGGTKDENEKREDPRGNRGRGTGEE